MHFMTANNYEVSADRFVVMSMKNPQTFRLPKSICSGNSRTGLDIAV